MTPFFQRRSDFLAEIQQTFAEVAVAALVALLAFLSLALLAVLFEPSL